MNLAITRALVRHIIETNRTTKWNMRSNGQFCLALDDRYQINIFDPAAAAEGRNDAHTHPRGFRSRTIAGTMRQTRYAKQRTEHTMTHIGVRLTPDYSLLGWQNYYLASLGEEVYVPGATYAIDSDEVHSANPSPGTVTLVEWLDEATEVMAFWPYEEYKVEHMKRLMESGGQLPKRPDSPNWREAQDKAIDLCLEALR